MYKVTRFFKAPKEEVFRWLTNYDQVDAPLSNRPNFKSRKIAKREGNTIVLHDVYEGFPLKIMTVQLQPPESWTAEWIGGFWQGHSTYKLREVNDETELYMEFYVDNNPNGYEEADLERRTNALWDSYVKAWEDETKAIAPTPRATRK